MAAVPDVWVLADDRAGNVAQAVGIAEALGLPFAVKDIRYGPIARLPNILLCASTAGLVSDSRAGLRPPWPRLVIAAGRRTAPVARWIKRAGGSRLVQIMDPGQGRADFDLIAIPEHDAAAPAGSNILSILGAPHRVTPRRLAAEADLWRDRLACFAGPRIAVIVGGSTKNRIFTATMARSLMQQAAGLAAELGGSLLVTTSRRTGPEVLTELEAFLPTNSFLFRWEEGAANPYPALLGLVDAIVVTGDSVSMCSEACAASVPVYVFAPDGLVAPKHARLHRALYRAGFARPFDGRFETWTHPPLNAADQIAGAVRARFLAS